MICNNFNPIQQLTHQQLVSCAYGNYNTWWKLDYKNWQNARDWKNAMDLSLASLFLKQSELEGEVPPFFIHFPLYFLLSSLYRIHLTRCDHRLMKHAERHFLALLYSQNIHVSASVGTIVTDT